MSQNPRDKYYELRLLITQSLSGTINPQDLKVLEDLLRNDSSSRKYYVDYLNTHAGLRNLFSVVQQDDSELSDGCLDNSLWLALAENEKTAPRVQIDKPKKEPLALIPAEVEKTTRSINKLSLYTAIASTAALIFIIVMTWLVPDKGPMFATLTDSIDAVWADKGSIASETELHAGKMKLISGLAKLQMYDGAVVTLQGATEIQLEGTNRIKLISGRVSAVVPDIAVGFVVRTNGVSIVDYGTEFGVTADLRGNIETHVFKGEIEMRLGNDPLVFNISQRVSQGNAVRKSADESIIRDVKYVSSGYVRSFSSSENYIWSGDNIKLADIVGGGNGFGTGTYGYGYDITTGRQIIVDNTAPTRPVSSQYRPVANRFIDGVFVPDGGKGAVTISTTGLSFKDCPDTIGRSNGDVFNGAWHNHILGQPSHFLKLNGRTFEQSGEAFRLNSNKGITFDLDAIRSEIPGVVIKSFKSYAGVSETVLELKTESSRVDFWILIDGELKLKQIDVKPEDKAFEIDLPITEQDRFLTLITTDSGSEFNYTDRDWALFAEPVLELELKQIN